MNFSSGQTALHAKLMRPLMDVLDQHRARLLPLLNKSGTLSRSALRSDDTMRAIATYSYALMPGLLRLAVKEHVFIDFVLHNRDKVLDRLTAEQHAERPTRLV